MLIFIALLLLALILFKINSYPVSIMNFEKIILIEKIPYIKYKEIN